MQVAVVANRAVGMRSHIWWALPGIAGLRPISPVVVRTFSLGLVFSGWFGHPASATLGGRSAVAKHRVLDRWRRRLSLLLCALAALYHLVVCGGLPLLFAWSCVVVFV